MERAIRLLLLLDEAAGRRTGQSASEEAMDQGNNAIGRQCGVRTTPKSCPELCMEKYSHCKFTGLGGGYLCLITP